MLLLLDGFVIGNGCCFTCGCPFWQYCYDVTDNKQTKSKQIDTAAPFPKVNGLSSLWEELLVSKNAICTQSLHMVSCKQSKSFCCQTRKWKGWIISGFNLRTYQQPTHGICQWVYPFGLEAMETNWIDLNTCFGSENTISWPSVMPAQVNNMQLLAIFTISCWYVSFRVKKAN